MSIRKSHLGFWLSGVCSVSCLPVTSWHLAEHPRSSSSCILFHVIRMSFFIAHPVSLCRHSPMMIHLWINIWSKLNASLLRLKHWFFKLTPLSGFDISYGCCIRCVCRQRTNICLYTATVLLVFCNRWCCVLFVLRQHERTPLTQCRHFDVLPQIAQSQTSSRVCGIYTNTNQPSPFHTTSLPPTASVFLYQRWQTIRRPSSILIVWCLIYSVYYLVYRPDAALRS